MQTAEIADFRRPQEETAPEFHGRGAHIAAGGDAAGALPLGGIRVFCGVNGIVEEVAGNLDAGAAQGCESRQPPVQVNAGLGEMLLEFPDNETAGPHRHESCGEGFGACGEDDGTESVHERGKLYLRGK